MYYICISLNTKALIKMVTNELEQLINLVSRYTSNWHLNRHNNLVVSLSMAITLDERFWMEFNLLDKTASVYNDDEEVESFEDWHLLFFQMPQLFDDLHEVIQDKYY